MAPLQKSHLTAQLAIIGLLAQEPDTVAGIAHRLEERFPDARWTRTTAHKSLPELERRGYVRKLAEGSRARHGFYEPTPQGLAELQEWLRDTSIVPPTIRSLTHAKLILARDEDMPWVLRTIREQEEACLRQAEAAQMRWNQQRRLGMLGAADSTRPSERVPAAIMTDEVMLWSGMAKRLKRLRLYVEGRDEDDEAEA